MSINSKLPHIGTNIFSIMSGMAREYQAINLAQGFPNFDTPKVLKELVASHLHKGKNQYAPMKGTIELREAIAKKINFQYQRIIDIDEEICVTSGASQALFTAILALVPADSEVIVIEPCYDAYDPAIKLAGAKTISYRLRSPEFKVDWSALEKLVTDKTSMIIVNTPHNPTGKVLAEEDLDQLYHIIKNRNIKILSDEVYEHLVFDDKKHLSLIDHDGLRENTIAVFSFGKTFHCTGWKIGYCIAPPHLMQEFYKAHQFNVFCVPHFIQCGIAEYLGTPEHYTSLPQFYQQKRDYFGQLMEETPFIPLKTQGSFFQVYDYSQLSDQDDMSFCTDLTKNHGVAAIPVSAFYTSDPDQRLIRFCFAKTEKTLEQAAQRLKL